MPKLDDYQKLNPLQRGKLFKQIREDQNLSYKDLAKKIGKSPSFIANSVRLLNLPVAIKDGLIGGVISEGHARALASFDNLNNSIEVYKKVLKNHSTVRETEEMVRDIRENQKMENEISEKQALKIKEGLEKILDKKITKIESKSLKKKIELEVFFSSD